MGRRALSRVAVVAAFCAVTGVGIAAPALAAAPKITAFTPISGPVGTSVTIQGKSLTGATAVAFNGTNASTYTVNSATQITATVPTGATTGPISVTTPGGLAISAASFTLTTTASIALSPSSGPPTTSVTVSGSGFGAQEGVDIYFDATDETVATTSHGGSFAGIQITVPATATPGAHWVSAVGRHSGLAAQASFTVQTNWPERGYSAKHRGKNPYENVLSPSTVSGIDEDWSYATGSDVYSSPAVANGVVYVGSYDDKVYALNASTGALLWSYSTGSYVTSSPAVANGVVYAGSWDDKVYALNASTGALLWSFTTGSHVFSSPAVANGVVYAGSEDDKVYAFDLAGGSQAIARPDPATLRPNWHLKITS